MTSTNIPVWLPSDPRKRRWLAFVSLLVVIGLITAAVAVPAVLLHRHYDENIARLNRQVSTQTAFNALRPRLTEKLAILKQRDVRKLYLKGASTALALAELQETVRTTIETNGARVISSVQGATPKEDGAYRPVTAVFTLSANNANLRRVLYALEIKEPYLFIDTVGIQPQIGPGYRPAPGTVEPEMFVQLEVRGYAIRAASELVSPVTTQAGTTATTGSAPVKARSPESVSKDKGGAT